jgi:hypothetical protein
MPAASPGSSVFELQSSVLEIAAELTIVAEVELVPSDVSVQTLDGTRLSSGSALVTESRSASEISVTITDEVATGSKLVVTVKAFDYERLPIARPDVQIAMSLFILGENPVLKGEANLLPLTANEYRAELPPSWIQDAGSYDLNIASSTGMVTLRFTVSSNKQRELYVALGISSVRRLCLRACVHVHITLIIEDLCSGPLRVSVAVLEGGRLRERGREHGARLKTG